MKFEVGDTVLLIHSGEEGTVTDILDDESVNVNVNGIVFPVYVDQIDFPYFNRFSAGRPVRKKGSPVRGDELPIEKPKHLDREEHGVLLSYLPEFDHAGENALVTLLKIHLVNETRLSYQFQYRLWFNQNLEFEISNRLHPFTHMYLHDMPFERLNDKPRLEFEFSLTTPDPQKKEVHELIFKPKAKQIMKKLDDLKAKQQATFDYLLFEQFPDKPLPEAWDIIPDMPKPGFIPVHTFPDHFIPTYETDLHIEKLAPHPGQLSVTDILAIQLGELQRQLDHAIAHRQFSLVAIHGVGKGRLRDEVHEILRHTPEVKYFVNQYDVRYGYGATEIFFEYK